MTSPLATLNRHVSTASVAFLAFALAAWPLAAEVPTSGPRGAEDRIRASIEWLAHDARDGRGAGTEGLEQTAMWLMERFQTAGLEPGADRGFLQAFEHAEHGRSHNVVGRIPPRGTRLPGVVVIGAHYDHLGFGGPSSLAPEAYEPHNGADDNASGTAALLEIARNLLSRRLEIRREIYLVAFAGEETGLRGSRHFVGALPAGLATGDLVAMLNLDMIGRLGGGRVQILGVDSAAEWRALVSPACRHQSLWCVLEANAAEHSDLTPFTTVGIPGLHFFTGLHDDYHRPSDDVWKIDVEGTFRIAALVTEVALVIAAAEKPPTYVSAGIKPVRE